MSPFVHLHVHSEYSLLDGAARITDLVRRAGEYGMKSLALTDHGVMYGAIPFYKACKENGIKPIIGCEAYLTAGSRRERGSRKDQPIYHLILLVKNETGYKNLMKLISIGHLEGQHYKPRIDMESLAAHAEGIICLSACLGGEVPQHLLHGREEEARKAALRYKEIFGADFYLELQDHGIPEQKRVNPKLIALAAELDIPLVATNDVHYMDKEDAEVQDVLICIGTGKSVDDEDRLKIGTDQLFFKSGEQMAALFPHVPQAIENTQRIAEACNLELTFGKHILPEYSPLPEGLDAAAYLRELCRSGLEERYRDTPLWTTPEQKETAEKRLAYELGVIESMGFSDYFLIVWDFIAFCHRSGIVTGPGRGSSAGSLTAYTLKITDVDPLKYNLLFERFLNPERITMPDIDIDFSDERRDEVIAYVVDKYGKEHVAQIITFGTMAARAAVRDVGRALNLPYNDVDKAAKLIPGQLGISIARALESTPELKALYEGSPKTRGLLDMAMKVEGMPRHASTHAAGVIISKGPLTDAVPLQAGSESTALTQYSMEHLESVGLLKMDFLGLRTLSIIERSMNWVREMTGSVPDFRFIPDHDPLTYEMLGAGETTGVFQLESAGVRRVLKDLKPSGFEDIVSVVALYRPGPMEFIPKFIGGKHGEFEVIYPHADLKPILADTYGIIVYQEQIMQIASLMAGFSLGEADLLRRAVSKKKRETLDKERSHFVEGSLKQGYQEADANEVYDMIVRFANYGFPRAHAAAYGVLAFQTAYLKAHYPVQFMAAMLTAVMGSHRKVAEYVLDCRRTGIGVLPPDVNESGVLFTPVPGEGSGHIRFGLAAVKNVGTLAVENIMEVRKERPFDSLLDFCRRVDLRVCNKRVIESLLQTGAFDRLPGHRAQLLAMLDETVDAALKWRKERDELQIQLFDDLIETPNWEIRYPDIPKFTVTQQLELERELLGLYLSGHPLDDSEALLEEPGMQKLMDLGETADESMTVTAGMVVSVKEITTKAGKAMAFVEWEDQIERCEVVLFPEVWKRSRGLIEKGALLALRAKVQQEDEGFKLLAEEVAPLTPDSVRGLLQRRSAAAARPAYAGRNASAGAPAAAPAARAGAGSPGARSGGAAGAAAAPGTRAPAAQPPGARVSAASAGAASQAPAASAPRPASAAPQGAGQSASQPPAQRLTGSSAAGVRQPSAPAGAQPSAASAGEAAERFAGAAGTDQRVFIKITLSSEFKGLLPRLQVLLQTHPGPAATLLFYERTQKVLALSDSYRIEPSEELFAAIEGMLGAGTVRIK